MSTDEFVKVVRVTVEQVKGKVPVIAGAGANSTKKAIERSRLAAECGADALLHVTPYYNKPTPEGLYRHFATIAQASPLPIILYNVPSRTGVNLLPNTVLRLASLPKIVGLKDASGSLSQGSTMKSLLPPEFSLLSGDDSLNYPLYTIGYQGAISVTANLVPEMVVACWKEWRSGNIQQAQALHLNLDPVNRAMFFESNPIPLKTALALMGYCAEEWRLPLCPMNKTNREKLIAILQAAKLI